MRKRHSTYLPPPILVKHYRLPPNGPLVEIGDNPVKRRAESPLLAWAVIGTLVAAILAILFMVPT